MAIVLYSIYVHLTLKGVETSYRAVFIKKHANNITATIYC